MSGLTFRLNAAPQQRLDLAHLTPKRLSSIPLAEVLKLNVGSTKSALTVGDVFAVSGKPGDTVRIESGSTRLDFVGAELDHGTVIVDGDVGVGAGRNMRGGRLEIRGDAGALLASGISGGEVFVKGSAAGQVGGLSPGDKFGMTGGLIVIDGHAGDRAGDRMRRGTIFIRGKCGNFAGSRMVGGTIWTELGFGTDPGLLLRRGTLIGPSVEQMLVDLRRHRQAGACHPARSVALHAREARRPGAASPLRASSASTPATWRPSARAKFSLRLDRRYELNARRRYLVTNRGRCSYSCGGRTLRSAHDSPGPPVSPANRVEERAHDSYRHIGLPDQQPERVQGLPRPARVQHRRQGLPLPGPAAPAQVGRAAPQLANQELALRLGRLPGPLSRRCRP